MPHPWSEYPLQKLAAHVLLERQHAYLAPRRIQQNAQRERQAGLGHKALQRLRRLSSLTVQSLLVR